MKLRTFGDSVRLLANRRNLVDRAGEGQLGIRVEADLHRLARPQIVHVGLVDARAHAHHRGVHDFDDRLAGAHFVPFHELDHVAAVLPRRLDHGHARERRRDQHPLGVRFRLVHVRLGSVAADLENPDVGGGGAGA